MDRDVWQRIMRATRLAVGKAGSRGRRRRFPDLLIVRLYIWAVWQDRTLCWAADPHHYGRLFRPRAIASVSWLARRVRTPAVDAILQRVHDDLAEADRGSWVLYTDGKPLPVSPVSKDRDARSGHVTGGFGKGYKLHARVTEDGRIVCWSVLPLDVAEQTVAMAFMEHSPAPGALHLADSNYDSAPLYKAVARAGGTLLTHLKGQAQVKGGKHHPVTLPQMGAARREAVAAWADHPDLCEFVIKARDAVERVFSALTCHAGGLGPLPAWVRTLGRVRRWVGVKIVLYHARLQSRRAAEMRAAA